MRTEADLIAEVNRSGFPLQLGIERLITITEDVSSRWTVRYREHSWQHPGSNNGGFIDLVLTQNNGVAEIVLECKRVQDTEWIFLQKSDAPKTVAAKGHISINSPKREVLGWHDLDAILSSPESEFCVAIGHDKNARSMLERTAATIVESSEALAPRTCNTYSPICRQARCGFTSAR